MRISLKAINSELERRGAQAVLTRGDGYFYFSGGVATDWLDRTVRVPTLHSFTLEQWIGQYRVLSEKNRALLTGGMTADTPEAEHPDGGGQNSDRERKHTRISAKKPEPRPGKKEKPLGSGHAAQRVGRGAPAILLTYCQVIRIGPSRNAP